MPKHQPHTLYLILALFFIALVILLFWWLNLPLLLSYFLSISSITFFFYGFDKSRAGKNQGRVPEIILHGLALAGGTPGAFLGQLVFHHKTQKLKFRIIFILIFLLQIAALIYYWKNLRT
jgi:uncharacterized membrane protein YsdA (DUF1294 family)